MLSFVAALCLQASDGPDPLALKALEDRCRQSHTWGLVVLRDGKPAVKRNFGNPWPMCNLMSATKSVTSIAIGMLIDEGKIPSVDTKLQTLIPSYQGKWKDKVTIRQLMEHTSGIRLYQDDPNRDENSMPENRVPSALDAPIISEPGTRFEYNNRAVDLLSGVVRKVSGKSLDQYLNQKLFKPLGIPYFQWTRDPDGNPHGCAELYMFPSDAAKIGQLMLQRGVWNGKRIVSERYVDEATRPSAITKGTGEECGQLWWICQPGFSIARDWRQKLSDRFGWPSRVIDRVDGLLGKKWPSTSMMAQDFARTAGGYPFLEAQDCVVEFEWDVLVEKGEDEPNAGYFANGWGGQYILVLPRQRVVAVRIGGDGFFNTSDSSKYEMGDFYRLVRDLYKE